MSRLRSLILLGNAALFVLLGAATAAAADDNFGAIAFSSSSGATGYSYDYDSRDGAEERKVVLWFKNACGALAVGEGSGYGTGWASSRSEAENLAMGYCRQNTGGCEISRWACTTR
jgi:hypothetical protein